MLAKKGKKRKVKKAKTKQVLPKVFGTIFVLFAVYLLYTNIMIFVERLKISSNYKDLDTTASSLLKEKEILKMQLGETYSDEYLERVAREELGLQKEGEKIVVIKKADEEGVKNEGIENKNSGPLDELFKWVSERFNFFSLK
ncbi:MAG: septum formation initiator family protein [Candidatus Paceibacterota bacterium]|jgi:cell division protein FtsB|nr:septum formation initiator family protein [bacterium]